MLNKIILANIATAPGMKILYMCVACSIFCQIIKFIFLSIKAKKPFWKAFRTAGGFPSSHTATVITMDFGLIFYHFKLPESEKCNIDLIIAVAVILSIIVIYDAMSVRYESGKHAQILNKLYENLGEEEKSKMEVDGLFPLTESLGHKVTEVIGGAVVGVIFGLFSFLII